MWLEIALGGLNEADLEWKMEMRAYGAESATHQFGLPRFHAGW